MKQLHKKVCELCFKKYATFREEQRFCSKKCYCVLLKKHLQTNKINNPKRYESNPMIEYIIYGGVLIAMIVIIGAIVKYMF